MTLIYFVYTFCAGVFVGANIAAQAYAIKINGQEITLAQDLYLMSPGWWEGNFKAAGDFYCKKYEILEQTYTPSTLSVAETKENNYYWVIRCENGKSN